MSKIKTREKVERTIKTIDKSKNLSEKFKRKENSVKEEDNSNPNNFAVNSITNKTKEIVKDLLDKDNIVKRSIKKSKENITNIHTKIKTIKSKLSEKKDMEKGIKIVKKESKVIAKETAKNTNRARKLAIESAKKTYQTVKITVKATASIVKYIVEGTKALITLIIAGGWLSVIIITAIGIIGIISSSMYGIFLSSEKFNDNITMNTVVSELNKELANKIIDIQNSNPHDTYVINSNRADWREILSVYTVIMTSNDKDVITIDEDKKNTIKEVFWKMNDLSYEVKDEQVLEDMTDKVGEPQMVNKKVLHIVINKKSIDEMKTLYNFNDLQNRQLDELLDEKNSKLWASAIYGTSIGNSDMVQVALSQVGNVGGEPYWRWYGFEERIEWCAVFVSWVANELGYIEANVIPKFSYCQNAIDWFKAMGEWKEAGFIPSSGDIIFFDWEGDGVVNHVGIVKETKDGIIYTVEGNSTNDTCLEQSYSIDSSVIVGFGTPNY